MTLSTIGFEDAWQAYRDCETRLPPKPTPVEPIVVDGVVDAVARLGARAVVLDGFGVLNNGMDALPGAAEAVARLRRLGIPIRVLTNDASALPAEIAGRHRRRGVEIDDDEVVSGLSLLASRLDERPGGWLIVATQVVVPELAELGLSLWDGSAAQLDAAGGFVMLGRRAPRATGEQLALQSPGADRNQPGYRSPLVGFAAGAPCRRSGLVQPPPGRCCRH